MENELKDILNACLIVPFEDEIVSQLNDICQKYALDADIEQIKKSIRIFLFNEDATPLQTYIESNISQENPVNYPPLVIRALAGIIVYESLYNTKTNLTNKDKEFLSLYTRNLLLGYHGHYNDLIALPIIKKIISLSEIYREEKNKIVKVEKSLLIPEIFNADTFTEVGITDFTKIFTEVKSLCQQLELLSYKNLIAKLSVDKEQDPFILAVNIVQNLYMNQNWTYVDGNPIRTIVLIFSNMRKKSASLKIIRERVYDIINKYEEPSDSSLLIRYLNKETTLCNLDDIKLNQLELAIYLYYELFLEQLIDKDNG